MFLKSLDVFGFKSFAEKTHIEFADGITALLGPNGCGKSNVVDAIKWVLGEQKSGALRADKMEDVIFSGTESRKALGVAEVTLTLANEDGLLPIDMPELQIRRRLYRSGESEYMINSQEKKLKDIRELFWDTGVGKAAYSVMEQGKIDQVLSSKPEDRRYLFEEAAGITSYKVKTHEAELKISKSEENIKQVEALVKEVKRNYDSLQAQSIKTEHYRALKSNIFDLERDIQLLKLKKFRDEHNQKGENLKSRTSERDALQTQLDEISKSLGAVNDEINTLNNNLAETQKNIFGLQKEKNGLDDKCRILNEQRSDIKMQIDVADTRQKAIITKIEELNEDADEQDDVVRNLQKQVGAIEENIKSFRETINVASAKIGENDASMGNCESEIVRLEEKRSVTEKKLEAITDNIVAELDTGLKNAGYSAATRTKNQNELENALNKLQTLLNGRETLLGDLTDAAKRAVEGVQLDSAQLMRVSDSLTAGVSEAAELTRQIKSLFAQYMDSTPTFIDEFLAPQGIITQKRTLDSEIRICKEGVAAKRQEITDLRGSNSKLLAKIEEYKGTLHDLQVNQARMATQVEAALNQVKSVRRQIAEQEGLLKGVQDEIFMAKKRYSEINESIADTETEIAEIEKKGGELVLSLEKLEKDIARHNNDVSGKEAKRQKQSAELEKSKFHVEKLFLEIQQSENEIQSIQDNFKETHSRDLMEFETRIYQITTTPAELKEKLAAERETMRQLGGNINFMAPEEFKEAKTRYDFLSHQLEDLHKAKSDLEQVASESRTKSSEMFMTSYNKIKKNFHNMFRRLFGGGQGQLKLVDSDHVLESGIEIFAQPPGKKLENITLLSGGEKSMTAVALLFATYMVKPSPFCFLDEIDAALDKDNVNRFVALLREFGMKSQFIVITHNMTTSTGASTLLGITMKDGVTQVVSLKLRRGGETGEAGVGANQDAEYIDIDFVEEDVEPELGRELD
ncbi:MAG: AAA family ATPase [Termitinemataceae bacterium]|nr:MAG: AAA family ATPase [Termitinemataceae bacterium]